MHVIQTTVAILVAFLCYGTLVKLYRRRRQKAADARPKRAVRAHDALRLTNL